MPRRSNQEIGEAWENEVKAFFNEELCFENVDGGSNFRPEGKQVDIVAGAHNVLFIGECKTKQELGKRGCLNDEIEEFRKKTVDVINGLKSYRGGKYARYTHFVLFIATKDIIWTGRDFAALTTPIPNNALRAHAFDEEITEYYRVIKEELSEDIAKTHLLADMGVRFPPQQALQIPVFKNTIKGITVYNFIITPQKILPYVSVARREAKIKEYYQRMVNGKRCQEIINYLDSPDTIFKKGRIIPGNIVLATRPNITIEEGNSIEKLDDTEFTTIKLPANYGILWIVDGQHRLYAYSKTSLNKPLRGPNADDKVFVTLLHNASTPQQRQIFVDINKEQKGVDLNYIIDIEGDANPQSYMGKISRLIKKIDKMADVVEENDEYKNIFYSKIRIPSHGSTKRKFSMKGIYDALERKKLVSPKIVTRTNANECHNPFFNSVNMNDFEAVEIGLNKLSKSIIQYFSVAKATLGDQLESMPNQPQYTLNYFLDSHMREGIVGVLLGFFERIIAARFVKVGKASIPNKGDFQKYLLPIAESLKNITNHEDLLYLINTSGQGNRESTIKRLCCIVRDAGYPEFDFDDMDDDLLIIVEETKRLETSLRGLINEFLSREFGPEWCKGGMTDVLPGRVEEALKTIRKSDIERNPNLIKQGKLYIGLTIGLSKDLILKHWERCFANAFVAGGDKFTNKSQFENALQHLELYRNSDYHGMLSEAERQIIKRPDQKRLAESYIKIFNKILLNLQSQADSSKEEESII